MVDKKNVGYQLESFLGAYIRVDILDVRTVDVYVRYDVLVLF
jgi:hypothetical protein